VFGPDPLDLWYERTAQKQYTRTLLFSTVYDLMSQVVFRLQPSVYAAHRAHEAQVGTSVVSVYNKLKEIEPHTSAALVRYSTRQLAPLIEQLGGNRDPWLSGYRVKIIDGNCLEASEHRLEVLRGVEAGALPGKSLAVYAPDQGLVGDLFPCEDGHAQERSLFGSVLKTVQAGDLWIADRNFCTRDFLCDIDHRGASFIIREHRGLPCELRTSLRPAGSCGDGQNRGATGTGRGWPRGRPYVPASADQVRPPHARWCDVALYRDEFTGSCGVGQAGGQAVSQTLDAGDRLPAPRGLFSFGD
jgi:hypothetical protein